jgi:oxygen-dependent protoporphyrinogen oxidase
LPPVATAPPPASPPEAPAPATPPDATAPDPARLDLGATMPRFLDLEVRHGSVMRGLAKARAGVADSESTGVRYGLFVSLRDGMERFVRVLAERIGRSLVLDAPVVRIERERLGYRVEARGHEPLHADGIVLALPAPRVADLFDALDPGLSAALRAIRFGSMSTVTLAYERSRIPHALDAFGLVVPAIEGRPVCAMTFVNVKWPGRAPEGVAILRVFVGGVARPHAPREPDDVLVAAAQRELRRLLGIEAAPLFVEIDRFIDAMPQYEIGHLDRVAAIETALGPYDRLAIAGNSLYGVGLPDAIAAGERAADRAAARGG